MTTPPINPASTATLLRGSAWMVSARWGMRLIGLFSTIILARLLAPDDFGVIAIALIVVGLLETLAYTGVDLALMRAETDSHEHFDTAWTIQILQGLLIAALLVAIAPFADAFFSEPRAVLVIQVLALRPMLIGFTNIGTVCFRKELDFAKDFRFTILTKVLNFTVVVTGALLLRSYWALVLGMVSSALIEVLLSYRMHPYRAKVTLKRVGELWNFSQWLMISRLGSYLTRRTDEFVIGRLSGTGAMGTYHVANELATMPSLELVMPVRRAMFPALSKARNSPGDLERLFLLSLGAIAALSLSVGFGLSAVSPEVVPLVLGKQWAEAVLPMRWLALFGAFSALTLTLEMMLWVVGKTRASAITTWLEFSLLIPSVVVGLTALGPEGAALARLGVTLTLLPVMARMVVRHADIALAKLVAAVWRPLAAGLLMYGTLTHLPLFPGASLPLLLALKVLLGLLIFPLALASLWLLSGRPDGIEARTLARWHRP